MALLSWNRWYLVDAARAAKYDPAAETWNVSSVAVPNLQSVKVTPLSDTDEMRIYGAVEHFLSVLAACDVEMEMGGLAAEAYEEMTSIVPDESGTATRDWEFAGGENLGYFGMILRLKVDGPGCALVYLHRLKLNNTIGIEAAKENKFIIPAVTAKAMRLRQSDESLYPVYRIKEFDTLQSIPVDFNTAFASL